VTGIQRHCRRERSIAASPKTSRSGEPNSTESKPDDEPSRNSCETAETDPRDRRAAVALAWKKEPQQRGALHWHLLFYGIEEDGALGEEVRDWFARQWNELICAKLDAAEKARHLCWHRHANNWQRVGRLEYFSKYVGKARDLQDGSGSTGRWWGFWRKERLPWAERIEGTIPDKVAVDLNRIARRIRQKRADAAKQAALAKRLACGVSPFSRWVSKPQPLTLWDLERLKAGYGPRGKGDPDAAFWLRFLGGLQRQAGVRFGKYRFKLQPGQPHPDKLKITLTGKAMPATLLRAAIWSAKRHGIPTG